MTKRLNTTSRLLVAFCSLAMIAVLYLPIWRIELTAPQYPEGLVLQIYATKIAGAVDIVNGLNHYIGMETLHTRDFVEFVVLPYIIAGFLGLGLLVAMSNRRSFFYGWYFLFILIAFMSLIDFYRWEYNYGHNLDPNAPIKVPGMVYQPPLIGYKQLLNFTAYSVPDVGGWVFAGVGILLTLIVVLELMTTRRHSVKPQRTTSMAAVLVAATLFLGSCHPEPQPIRYGRDDCDFCKMGISDIQFGAELLTKKGKAFKFDDMHCLLGFTHSGEINIRAIAAIYFVDFCGGHELINADDCFLLKSELLHAPMGGNTVAIKSQDSAVIYRKQLNGQILKWDDLYK